MTYDPYKRYDAGEVEFGLRAALTEIYGPNNPLTPHVVGAAVGHMVLGQVPAEALRLRDESLPYGDRVRHIAKPADVAWLAGSAAARLRCSVPHYLQVEEDGSVRPYVWDGDKVIGQVFVRPPTKDGRDYTSLELHGGPKNRYDPSAEGDREHAEFSLDVGGTTVWDSLSGEHVTIPYLQSSHGYTSRQGPKIPIDLPTKEYVLRYGRSEKIATAIFGAVDSAVGYYENKYLLHSHSGFTYAEAVSLGYTNPDGTLMTDWMARLQSDHPGLLSRKAPVAA